MSWLWALGAYLCGSIPFGLLISKAVTGADVRAVGSGNIGATNVARAAGRPAAIATLFLDALKGIVPVLLAARAPQAPPMLASVCAFAAVLGHCFPVWLRLRGGKGVATGLGVALALGSLAGVLVALGVALLTAARYAVYGLLGVALLIILRHLPNIRRLLARQEG